MVFFPDLHFHSYISKKDVQFWFLNGFERIHYYNYEIMTPHEELNLRNSVALASTRRKKKLSSTSELKIYHLFYCDSY